MLRILSSDLWSEIARLARRRGIRRAAVAYVSSDASVAFRAGDELIVNASDDAVRAGQTSAVVLHAAFSRGAALFSNPNLHAKVLVVRGVAVVSSANVSQSSREVLHEVGIITDDPEIVGGATHFIAQLARESIAIDTTFMERILAIPVIRRSSVGTGGRQKRVRIRGGRTWILGLSEDPVYPGDEEEIESVNKSVASEADRGETVDWFWWSGRRSRFLRLAKVGDRVISMYRPRQSDKSTRTVKVYRHCVIRRIFANAAARRPHTTAPHGQIMRQRVLVGVDSCSSRGERGCGAG